MSSLFYLKVTRWPNLKRKLRTPLLLLPVLFCLSLKANTSVSQQKITIQQKNKALIPIIKEIERQSEFTFLFDANELKKYQNLSLNIKNLSLTQTLTKLFTGFPLEFKIINNTVLIKTTPNAGNVPIRTAAIVQEQITVRGTVSDGQGTIPGVTVALKSDSKVGIATDVNGRYTIKVPPNGTLVFSLLGYEKKEVMIKGENIINVTLNQSDGQLDEIAIVAFGAQKKSTMVGSVTSINPKELKGPTSNLTTMLAGRVAGIIAYQRSGEPGRDNAEFFIRGVTTFGTGKKDPLILINGIEVSASDLARIQPDDIAGFSILKDATASSLYGARGANGVVLVTTKSGTEGKTKFNVRFENSLSSNTDNFQLADNISYMKLANEAASTRNPLLETPYDREKIDYTVDGENPMLYPNNDWMKLMIKDYTNNQRLNMNLNGGGEKAQYYISGTYNIDNGVLKTISLNNFNSNVRASNFEVRSNVNVKLTNTTEAIIRTTGQFDSYNGPIGGGSNIFAQVIAANPVMFPAIYPQSYSPFTKHSLFGNSLREDKSFYVNPFANSVSGFQKQSKSNVTVQFELKQDFDFITPGLTSRLMTYTRRNSYFDVSRQLNPFYYGAKMDPETGFKGLEILNEETGTEYLTYSPGDKVLNTYNYLELATAYNKTIGTKHELSAMLIGLFSDYQTGNAITLQNSLPHRNLGISGRFTYGYDNRYLMEFNFGYNGSERFDVSHRFGFFPSVGAAWNVYNEKFFEPIKSVVNKLKFRGTYGLVGNDQIGLDTDRFFYLANVNMNAGDKGYAFGDNYTEYNPGISISRYENKQITWERAYKTNVGFELGLFNALNVEFDIFKEKRTNILMTRSNIPSSMGLNTSVMANVGEAQGQGMDIALDYNKTFTNGSWVTVRGNFTYATSKLLVNEEPEYEGSQKTLSKVGYSLGQVYGLIAERYFVDDTEVLNSPLQNYGAYMGGDIKYRDVNGDGQITSLDIVPIGYPTTPEIIYGFGFSYGYKSFDISAFFQGSARSSFWINSGQISPFAKGTGVNIGKQNGLLSAIADSHWSESNRDMYAFWPRLSPDVVSNNTQTSTWWMRNGAFLRLKTVELGHNVSPKILKRTKLSNVRIYTNALNLFALSKFKMWDTEMGGNGLGYPVQRVINFGINVGF